MDHLTTVIGCLEPGFSLGKATPAQRAAVQTLLRSQAFSAAPRLRAILEYLFQVLNNGAADVTEQSIGQAVFGRPPGYNSSEDNIVRVNVRHLRTRLEEFYSSEGRDELVVLFIPKGKYVPVFMTREADPVLIESFALPEPGTSPTEASSRLESNIPVELADRPVRWSRIAAIAAVTLVAFFSGWALRSTTISNGDRSRNILAALCSKDTRLLVIVVDSNLQAYRSIFGKQVSLNDYINRHYANEPLDSTDPRIANALHIATDSNDTNVSSAILAADVQRSLGEVHVTIKQPRDVSMREFQDQPNIILLGGPWVNPWGQLFEKRLNFRVTPLSGVPAFSEIHNEHPRSGEPSDFTPHKDGNLSVDYVRIAVVPGFNGTGHIFLLGATSTEALEAGGNYLLSRDTLSTILREFHAKKAADLPPFELVLEVRGFDSVPGSRIIVASRVTKE
jgi:hypothetical protein